MAKLILIGSFMVVVSWDIPAQANEFISMELRFSNLLLQYYCVL